MPLPSWAINVQAQLQIFEENPWVIGLSGGCDSIVLYHLLKQLFPHKEVCVAHANHQLHPDSGQWAFFVSELARKHGDSVVSGTLDCRGSSESQARLARYDFFEQVLISLNQPVLLLAHHRDDANETALWRFLRGAPPGGLLGMPERRILRGGQIVRPLLDVSQEMIANYAQQQHLRWVTDPSNAEQKYTRNFLRHQIMPQLQQRGLDQIVRTREQLLDHAQALLAHQQPFFISSVQLPWTSYPVQQESAVRSLIQNWLSYHHQPQPAVRALRVFVGQLQSGAATPMLDLPGGQRLAAYQGQIWRESRLWWDTPAPEPLLTDTPSGEWGLWRWEGLQDQILLRRLRKSDILKGSGPAPKYWAQNNIPPWRRPFYPALQEGQQLVQYAHLWAQEGKEWVILSCLI